MTKAEGRQVAEGLEDADGNPAGKVCWDCTMAGKLAWFCDAVLALEDGATTARARMIIKAFSTGSTGSPSP